MRMSRWAGIPAIAALLSAMVLLPGCTTTGGAAAVNAAVPGGGVCTPTGSDPIRLATAPDVSRQGVRNQLIKLWNNLCPQHKVQLVELPPTADGQRSQMVAAEQSGDTTYDVLNLDVTWTAEFAAADLIKPLAGAARSDFLRNAWGTVEYKDKVWAIPFNSDAGLLFYRTDAGFSKAPQTWSDLQTDLQISGRPRGYITQLAHYEGLTVNVLEAVWNAGGDLVDGNGRVGSSLLIQKGLDQLKAERTWMPYAASQAHEAESLQAFAQGQVVFMRGWPYMYDVLIADGLKPGAHFNVAQLPGEYGPGSTVLGGQNLAVAAHSRNPSLARQLIDFLTSRESERCLLEGGFAATRASAFTTGSQSSRCPLSLVTGSPTNESGHTAASVGDLPPYSDVLYAALSSAKPRPITPFYAAFTQFVQADVSRFFQDSRTDVVTDMTNDLRKVLAGRL